MQYMVAEWFEHMSFLVFQLLLDDLRFGLRCGWKCHELNNYLCPVRHYRFSLMPSN